VMITTRATKTHFCMLFCKDVRLGVSYKGTLTVFACGKVRGRRGELCNEELNNLYSSPNNSWTDHKGGWDG
jgi:hypothetical protein